MPLLWTFRYHLLDDQKTGVRHVYSNAHPETRARFASKLKYLGSLAIVDWREPLFKVLKGQDGLSEIRFKAKGVQQRPLGFRSGDTEYTLLFWATEKGNKFVPLSACDTAKTMMAAARADRSLTDALWIALE